MITMDRSSFRVMAIDPGDTCGYVYSDKGLVTAGEMIAMEFLFYLNNMLMNRMVDRVVYENFHGRRLDPDSQRTIEVIGVIKWIAMGIPIATVEPSSKAKFIVEANRYDIVGGHARAAEAVRLWDQAYGKW